MLSSLRCLSGFSSLSRAPFCGLLDADEDVRAAVGGWGSSTRQASRFFNIFQYYQDHAHTEGQKRVRRDLEHGYWKDANQLAKTPDGRFTPGSGSTPIHPQSAQVFPLDKLERSNQIAQLLTKHSSILLLVSQQRMYADQMIQTWRKPLLESHPELPVRELVLGTVLDAFVKPLLAAFYKSQLTKAGLPTNELMIQPIFSSRTDDLRFELNIQNRYVCYPLLIDRLHRIRWRAVGTAIPEDLRDLLLVAQRLERNANDDSLPAPVPSEEKIPE